MSAKPGERQLYRWTLEQLEKGDTVVAAVWRALRATGPATVRGLDPRAGAPAAEISERAVQAAMTRLCWGGWARRVGTQSAGVSREAVYEALLEAIEPKPRAEREPAPHELACRRLTLCIKKAAAARRSGLAQTMSRGLLELETDIAAVREYLSGGGRSKRKADRELDEG